MSLLNAFLDYNFVNSVCSICRTDFDLLARERPKMSADKALCFCDQLQHYTIFVAVSFDLLSLSDTPDVLLVRMYCTVHFFCVLYHYVLPWPFEQEN